MKQVIRGIYHKMQQHYWSFRILVWLKEHGITRKINFYISHFFDKRQRAVPTAEMKCSEIFYKENKERIAGMLNMLSDDKSKMVWGG